MRETNTRGTRALVSFALFAGASLFLGAADSRQRELGDPITFTHSGDACRVSVRAQPAGGTAIVLESRTGERTLSPAGGDNLFPKVQTSGDRLYVLWVRYQAGGISLGLYDSHDGSAGRTIPIDGLSFIGSPVVVEEPPHARGIVFLGNESDNDDIFFLDLISGRLINLTRTPASEKRFVVESTPGGIRVRADMLREKTILQYDFRTANVQILRRVVRRASPLPSAKILAGDDEEAARTANTYIAFGDSITWGKMRMNGLEGEYHPELAYPARMVAALQPIYGPAYPVNLGVAGETTFDGVLRVEADLEANPGAYFLLMMGTNDVVHGAFSVDGIMENIDFLIGTAEAAALKTILSTIPPRKDELGSNPVVHQKMIDLNARIAEFAEDRGVGFVDTFGTFMAHDFPDGWKALLEDSGGNHPSPAGHDLIAGLFAERLVLFPPRAPSRFEKALTANPSHWRVQWQPSLESDLACYRLEYGATETTMTNVAVLNDSFMVFPGFPSRVTFFRVQAVDASGYRSEFSGIRSTAERDRPRGGDSPHKGEIIRWR